ncbi:MAG: ribose-5-phosphate isomerase RpiA [Ardenticatenaceae bacterium]|nr:ribose-5-phosphate isomerase RpiA [Ardenticatenaceae bacterium]
MSLEELKREAAVKAVEFVHSGMVVGLGTGSTAVHATRAMGEMLANGRLHNIVAIPTSQTTARQAQAVGIPLTTLNQNPHIDITIDGADEIDPHLNLIKGLGGALLREKIVAIASQRVIIVADDRKHVSQLGSRAPVPVEVIRFAQQPVHRYLQSLGARVVLRQQNDEPFITDENNIILDCYFGPIANPSQLAADIRQQPGVVEHGLFLSLATDAIIASAQGIEILHK